MKKYLALIFNLFIISAVFAGNDVPLLKSAKEMGITTIAFTGEKGGVMKEKADICLNVPSDITNNIQEMHIACGHLVCGIVEDYFFGEKK